MATAVNTHFVVKKAGFICPAFCFFALPIVFFIIIGDCARLEAASLDQERQGMSQSPALEFEQSELFDKTPVLQIVYCAETRGEYLPCAT